MKILAFSGLFCLPAMAVGAPMFTSVPQAADVTLVESGSNAVLVTDAIFEGPAYVDAGQQVAFMRSPVVRDGASMANAFHAMCVSSQFDQTKFDAAAAASGLGLVRKEVSIPPMRKDTSAVTIVDWQSSSVRAELWSGHMSDLKGRSSVARIRGLVSAQPFRPSKQVTAECNMLFDTKGFVEPGALIAGLTAKLGVDPVKMVVKSKWADGYWQLADMDGYQYKVVFSGLELAEVSQVVHIALLKSAPKTR